MASDLQPVQSTRRFAKQWCFTAFSSDDGLHPALDWPWINQTYGIYQHEQCPTTGRFHLQGFVCFSKRVLLSYVKRLHPTAHFQVARGSPADNYAYCTKLDTRVPDTEPTQFNTLESLVSQGKSTEYTEALDHLRANPSAPEIDFVNIAPSIWIRYPNAYARIRQLVSLDQRRRAGVRVIVIIGPPGCGKSIEVLRRYSGAYLSLIHI